MYMRSNIFTDLLINISAIKNLHTLLPTPAIWNTVKKYRSIPSHQLCHLTLLQVRQPDFH